MKRTPIIAVAMKPTLMQSDWNPEATVSRRARSAAVVVMSLCSVTMIAVPAAAQVDQERASAYFREAAALCEREGGRLWELSLCGPMVFADAVTGTIATNQAAPETPRPRALGYANAAMEWGGLRWSTFVWQMIPTDENERFPGGVCYTGPAFEALGRMNRGPR